MEVPQMVSFIRRVPLKGPLENPMWFCCCKDPLWENARIFFLYPAVIPEMMGGHGGSGPPGWTCSWSLDWVQPCDAQKKHAEVEDFLFLFKQSAAWTAHKGAAVSFPATLYFSSVDPGLSRLTWDMMSHKNHFKTVIQSKTGYREETWNYTVYI